MVVVASVPAEVYVGMPRDASNELENVLFKNT